jgi:hypothetical protein
MNIQSIPYDGIAWVGGHAFACGYGVQRPSPAAMVTKENACTSIGDAVGEDAN